MGNLGCLKRHFFVFPGGIMVVYAIDERWPVSKLPAWKKIEAKHRSHGTVYAVVEPLINEREDSGTIVRRIKEAVRKKGQSEKSIWLLRLCAHGFSGHFQLGKGLKWYNTTEWAPAWRSLADWMTKGGRGVEIWGCGIASETDVREVPSRTSSGRSEFRPGSIPKPFVRSGTYNRYYQRGPFGAIGGLGAPRQKQGETTVQLLFALSRALGVQVRAPIHAQPGVGGFTELHGPTVTVHVTNNGYTIKLNLRPPDRASVRGPLVHS